MLVVCPEPNFTMFLYKVVYCRLTQFRMSGLRTVTLANVCDCAESSSACLMSGGPALSASRLQVATMQRTRVVDPSRPKLQTLRGCSVQN